MNQALICRNMSAGYHHQPVLHDISAVINAGEMVAVLGPNGAGKTTWLRAVTGLCSLISGTVELFGNPLQSIGLRQRAALLAVMPQEMEMPFPFTVEELLGIARRATLPTWQRPGPEDFAIISSTLVEMDLINLRSRAFNELSGGEKQRVLLSMAVVRRPRLLLLDEATAHLDLHHRIEVMERVCRLNRETGVTVLTVTHDINLAAQYCSRVILINRGKVAADAATAEVLQPAILEPVYQCRVRVLTDPESGIPAVLPQARRGE